jgi:hypothetical protein
VFCNFFLVCFIIGMSRRQHKLTCKVVSTGTDFLRHALLHCSVLISVMTMLFLG